MDNSQKQLQSLLSHAEVRTEVQTRLLIGEFAKAIGIPGRLLSKYWEQVDIAAEVDRESIFNRVFHTLPFYVAAMPLPKSKDATALHQLEGKKGGDLVATYLAAVARLHHVAAGRVVVALFKLPYMDGAYVAHAMDTDVINPLQFPGGKYMMPSEKGGHIVIQAAVNFAKHPKIKTLVEHAIGNM